MKRKASKTEASNSTLASVSGRGTDPSGLPFQEWSDHEVHTENWNDGGKCKFEVYVNTYDYPDLISGSKHLLHSEFVRSFISSIHTLMYLGETTRFDIEYLSPNFVPPTRHKPWRPWHLIYSNQNAGTSAPHSPTFNSIGKYIVRLFWMGSWRKVYVDDRLPVDMLNHVMLPSFIIPIQKEELEHMTVHIQPSRSTESVFRQEATIELWPYLLSKALLKIASLSWYEDNEIVDFDIIQCLTGWFPQRINTQGLSSSEVWDICWAYTNHYSWPSEENQEMIDNQAQDVTVTHVKRRSKKSSSLLKVEKEKDQDTHPTVFFEVDNPCVLVARCNDLRNFKDDDLTNIFPCWSHELLIRETRNIPLRKPTVTADLEFWKKLRWLSWATKKGMIPEEELLSKIMSYKLVSPFRRVFDHVVYKQPSKVNIETIESPHAPEPEEHEAAEKGLKGGKGKEQKKENKDQKENKKGSDIKNHRGERSSVVSKKSTKSKSAKETEEKKESLEFPLPDPSFWVDYEELSKQINTITVYFKPSQFKTKLEISDLYHKQQKGKKEEELVTRIMNPLDLQKCRNEPLYVFCESIDDKLIVLNLSQTGYTDILQYEKSTEDQKAISSETIAECEFCLAALIKRVKGNVTKEEVRQYIPVGQLEHKLVRHKRPCTHFVLERYNWKTDKLGDMVTSLNSYGSKTMILSLSPGRKIFKLWINSETPYIMHIFADTPVVVGSVEQILTCMSHESQLLENICINVANTFGKLTETFCMPEFSTTLKEFYSSYKPEQHLTKLESALVHDVFYDSLCGYIKDNLTKKELFALKVLLLRWERPLSLDYREGYQLCNCYSEEDFEYLKDLERHIVKVQALLRGNNIRQLMKMHDQSHRDYTAIVDGMTNIYSSIFSVDKRFTVLPNILRSLFSHPSLSKIRQKYTLYDDLENVLTLKQISNNIKISEGYWALLCRQLFSIQSKNSIPVKINFLSDIEQFVLRVVDNDKIEEISRFTNNVAVGNYESNSKGYTVLCYVWSPTPQNVSYRLTFATKKKIHESNLILSPTTTETIPLNGIYIPNINNIICRYLLKVRCERTLLTIYFSTSHKSAQIQLNLYDSDDILLQKITGRCSVILPSIVLENKRYSGIFFEGGSTALEKKYSKVERKYYDKRSGHSLQPRKSAKLLLESHSSITLQTAKGDNSRESKKQKMCKPEVYVIEVSVTGESWPLTAEEWQNVDNAKVNEISKLIDEQSTSPYSLTSRTSTSSLKKQRKSGSSLRIQGDLKQKESKKTLTKPYWVMQAICNNTDYIDITKDTKRDQEISDVKFKWRENDPDRLKKGHAIRSQFLEEHEIINPGLPQDISPNTRSLIRNELAKKIVPPLDLSPYYNKTKDAECKRQLKSDCDFDMDYQNELSVINEYEQEHERNVEKMDQYIEEQIKNLDIINNWFSGIRQESRDMMTEAMNKKSACIRAMHRQQENEKEVKEEEIKETKKDKKKGKKDKKG